MYSEAEPLIVKCLDLCVKMVGEKHAHVASCHNNIAGLLRNQVWGEAEAEAQAQGWNGGTCFFGS